MSLEKDIEKSILDFKKHQLKLRKRYYILTLFFILVGIFVYVLFMNYWNHYSLLHKEKSKVDSILSNSKLLSDTLNNLLKKDNTVKLISDFLSTPQKDSTLCRKYFADT